MENEMKRVIDINLDLTNSSLQGNEPVKTSRIFYTTDIGTSHLRFTSKNEISNSTASIVLKNITDGSKIQKNIVVTGKIFSYILGEEIEHAGDWIGQVIIEKDDKSLTSRSFKFQINGGLLDSSKPSLSDVDDYNKLYKQLNDLNDEMDNYLRTATLSEEQRSEAESVRNSLFEKFEVNERQRLEAEANRINLFTEFEENEEVRKNNELNREETYEIKIDSAIIEADLVTKVNNKVMELTPTIQEVTEQLAQKVGKNATDLSIDMFNENDRNVLQGQLPGTINAVLGLNNVTPENTSFLYPSPQNIYNYKTNKDGIRYGTTGAEIVDVTYSSSDYIKVEPGKYIVGFPDTTGTVSVARIPFYDNDKIFQSILSAGFTISGALTIEIDIPKDGYIRSSVGIEQKDRLVIAKIDNFDGFHNFSWVQDVKSLPKLDSVGEDELKKGSVNPAITNFLELTINLFNKNDVVMDSFYNIPPSTIPFVGYYTLKSPIRLQAGTYIIQKVRQWGLYSTNHIRLSFDNTNDNNANVTFTATEDVLLYMSGTIDNLNDTQVEKGSVATEVSEYGYNFKALQFTKEQIDSLKQQEPVGVETGDIIVKKSGETFTLTSNLSETEKISIITERHSARNNSFNFVRTEIDGATVHSNSDDITPIRTFSTVGANHGYTTIIVVTMASHGKTTADLGSKWTDGATVYTLLLINGNDLTFGCPYTLDSNNVPSSARKLPTSNLTHISGATNATAVDISTTNTGQLYPSINKITVKYVLDGKEIKEDGTYYGDELQVIEKYNVMDYKSIIDFAQNNIGTSYANDSIEGIVQISNTFTFTKGLKNTTSHGLKALKNVLLGRCGFLQAIPINLSGHTRKRFMPNVKVKSGFDFETGVNLDSYSTDLVFANSDNKKIGVPPNHVIDWLYDSSGNKKYGFTIGYIPDKTNSKNSDRTANALNTWDMRGTTKLYPIAVEGKLLLAGDYMNFEGYRNYLTAKEVGEATNLNVVRDNKDTYLIADFNTQAKGFSKELNNAIGKDVVNIQSENIELKNDVVDSNGVVLNTTAGISNGIFKAR